MQLLLQEEILRKTEIAIRTDIVLFTGAYEKRLSGLIRPIYEVFAQGGGRPALRLAPRLKELDFDGRTVPDNDLKWIFWNLALMMGLRRRITRAGSVSGLSAPHQRLLRLCFRIRQRLSVPSLQRHLQPLRKPGSPPIFRR